MRSSGCSQPSCEVVYLKRRLARFQATANFKLVRIPLAGSGHHPGGDGPRHDHDAVRIADDEIAR